MSFYILRAKRTVYEGSKLILSTLREVHQAWRTEQRKEAEELLVVLEEESNRIADLVKVARARFSSYHDPNAVEVVHVPTEKRNP